MLKKIIAGWGIALIASTANAVEVLTNGDFETGDLSGWSASGGGTTGTCPNENRTWNVAGDGSATGCNDPGLPPQGTYAAYNMFDGGNPSAPVAYQLSQSVSVPSGVSAATLSWSQSVDASFSGAPRVLAVEITNAAGDTILDTIRSTDYLGSESTGWTSETEDLTANLAALEGQTVNLRFSVYISENWTGPAGLGLDSVSLDITAASQSAPAPVPTMSFYGLFITALGMILVAVPRLRRHLK